jgi:hypothetical protein
MVFVVFCLLIVIEYRVKKAKELGLPIPAREVSVVRNPHQEFAARLEEAQSQSQMTSSLSTLVCCFYVLFFSRLFLFLRILLFLRIDV